MSWHDKIEADQIIWLKENAIPFGLCTEWKREALHSIHAEDIGVLQVYDSPSGWMPFPNDRAFGAKAATYRLNPDWKRPEEKPEKKEGHWEYCEVKTDASDDVYSFSYKDLTWTLNYAQSFVGFGGIEFEEKPDIWCCSLMHWTSALQLLATGVEVVTDEGKGARPATPKRVRFWVE